MHGASRSRFRYQSLAQFPRLRPLLVKFLSPKPQHRSRRTSRREIIQLILIILGSIVAVIVGLYGGITSSHHHEH
jgi:type VI protein secretion system component VasF